MSSMVSSQKTADARRAAGRAPWGTINRDRIVDAAERAVRAGGYEQMTIRSLAADLGISPMALYHHVRDKDDLLDEVVDRLLTRAWKPRANPVDWRAWMTEAADKLRRLLVSQPAALHVYLTHPVVSPAAIARMDAVMNVLRQALADEQAAQRAYAAVHPTQSASRPWKPPGPGSNSAEDREQHEAEASPVDQRSAGSESPDVVLRLAAYTTPDQFRQGLTYLLNGIERA